MKHFYYFLSRVSKLRQRSVPIIATATSAYFFSAQAQNSGYDYDLIVIGGGSGGLSCAKTAADLGARVALFDYVKPSPQGTKWGLGGTCVNVGCIPKKLMHYTAILGTEIHDAKVMGWDVQEHHNLDWSKMMESVNNYVRSLNWGYRVQLTEKNITYEKALARFVDPHTISFEKRRKGMQTITGANIVIAVGGRPSIPDIPGKELAITSDDIFWKQDNPGKTLCVGASYISLETAGFLNEFGCETHIMVRSILLRGFDREVANLIGEYMDQTGCIFHNRSTPQRLDRTDDGRIKVTYEQKTENENGEVVTTVLEDVYDTVMFATGRRADTAGLGLEEAGVEALPNGKIEINQEATNVPHIFAIGDVAEGKQELTPVAIAAGKLLSHRLFGGSTVQMDYDTVPTTVFTPVEYGTVGLSEEEAIQRYGVENVDVYWRRFTSLEHAAVHRTDKNGNEIANPHFAKLVVNTSEHERVLGFHYLGPNAGEVCQGYALAMKLGATKNDFDTVIGIHPTVAENFTTLDVTKSSGKDGNATGC